MKITWLGHSCFEIDNILIDPFITENPESPRTLDQLKPEIIAVTHGHADHLGDTTELAKNDCTVIAIHEIANYLRSFGINAIGMNIGGTVEIDGKKFIMTHAFHSSGIDEADFKWSGGSPAGYVIDIGARIYHAGDTSLFTDMKLIKELYTPEIALLPIGGVFTMGIKEAAIATSWLNPKIVIPMHYNTFPPIKQDPQKFVEAVKSVCDTEVVILKPGESLDI